MRHLVYKCTYTLQFRMEQKKTVVEFGDYKNDTTFVLRQTERIFTIHKHAS